MIKQASRDFSLFLLKESKLHFCDQLEKLETKPVITATLFPRCLFPDAVWPAQHTGDEQRLKLDTSASICGIKWPEASFVWQSTTLIGKIKKISSLRSIPIQLCALLESCQKWSLEVLQLQHRKQSKCNAPWATKSEVWTFSWSLSQAMLKTVPKAEDPAQSISIPRMTSETNFKEFKEIQPFWTPSKDISWEKDHDQDHLSHLTRIPNSKSSNWKGFKLKKMNSILLLFLASSLDIGPILGESERKNAWKSNWMTDFYDNFGAQTCSCPLMSLT